MRENQGDALWESLSKIATFPIIPSMLGFISNTNRFYEVIDNHLNSYNTKEAIIHLLSVINLLTNGDDDSSHNYGAKRSDDDVFLKLSQEIHYFQKQTNDSAQDPLKEYARPRFFNSRGITPTHMTAALMNKSLSRKSKMRQPFYATVADGSVAFKANLQKILNPHDGNCGRYALLFLNMGHWSFIEIQVDLDHSSFLIIDSAGDPRHRIMLTLIDEVAKSPLEIPYTIYHCEEKQQHDMSSCAGFSWDFASQCSKIDDLLCPSRNSA